MPIESTPSGLIWFHLVSGQGLSLIEAAPATTATILPQVRGVRIESSNLQLQTQTHVDTWVSLVRETHYKVAGVRSVYFAKHENNLDIWVLIEKRDTELVRRIAEAQHQVIRSFSIASVPQFEFDFHIVYQGNRPASELVPLRAIELPRT